MLSIVEQHRHCSVLTRSRYDGDLTFTLFDKFNITIPNHQLVIPDRHTNDFGTASTRELMINPLLSGHQNAQDFPLLGQSFLTSAHIMVNYDKNVFTLWQANATSDEDLVVILPSSVCKPVSSPRTSAVSYKSTSQATSTITLSVTSSAPLFAPPSSPTATSSATSSATLSVNASIGPPRSAQLEHFGFGAGAIAGIAIGCLVFLVMLALALVYIQRLRKRKVLRRTEPTRNNNELRVAKDRNVISAVQVRGIHELPGDLHLYEMSAEQLYEMGCEMPHELSAEPQSPALRP